MRNAQKDDLEVLITIWGTPKWANGGKTPNFLPTRMSDLTAFSRAVASRYSGRFGDIPCVRFYSIWNESNLQLFLAPQFDSKGKSVGPRNYAKLAAAGYAGIKAGNPMREGRRRQHLVGGPRQAARREVGDALARPLRPARGRCEPAAEVRRVGAASVPGADEPEAEPVVKWPNVTLSSFPRFEKSLDTWFKRKNVRIWITEYGHEVKQDGEPNGVSRATQANYTALALALAKKDPRTDMFIWFIFRDHATSTWQSGLRTTSGAPKPSLAKFRSAAASANARNAIVNVRGGIVSPVVTVPLRAYGTGTRAGEAVGFNVTIRQRGTIVKTLQPTAPFRRDATASFRLTGFRPAKGKTYTVEVVANVKSGGGVMLTRR